MEPWPRNGSGLGEALAPVAAASELVTARTATAQTKATRCNEMIVPVLSSGTSRPAGGRQRNQVEGQAPVVECTMFYVLIFSLAAVLLIIAGVTAMSRRRRSMRGEEAMRHLRRRDSTYAAHGTHPDAAGRRNRKAKRAQSQHDRRKRH